VYNRLPVNDTSQVWWDDIKIEPYIKKASEVLNKPMIKPVAFGNYQKLDFNIRGLPIAMAGNVSIDGSNFPGFYYDIDKTDHTKNSIYLFPQAIP